MKRCARCGQDLPLSAFGACRTMKDGLNIYCRPCAREIAKARYAAVHPKKPTVGKIALAVGRKRCSDCGSDKPLTDFPKGSVGTDGHKSYCKTCHCERERRRRIASRDTIAARRRALYATRIEEMRARDRARRRQEGEARNEKRRLAHRKNPETLRQQVRRWRDAHLETIRQRAREYQKAHPEGQWARNAIRRARVRNAPVVEKVDRQTIIERDRSICGICGEVVAPKDIHLDHILPLFLGGTHTADNLRVTHRLCNLSRKRDMNNS
jgi:5-methylcytosine-specific restriction endonuclease McrA